MKFHQFYELYPYIDEKKPHIIDFKEKVSANFILLNQIKLLIQALLAKFTFLFSVIELLDIKQELYSIILKTNFQTTINFYVCRELRIDIIPFNNSLKFEKLFYHDEEHPDIVKSKQKQELFGVCVTLKFNLSKIKTENKLWNIMSIITDPFWFNTSFLNLKRYKYFEQSQKGYIEFYLFKSKSSDKLRKTI